MSQYGYGVVVPLVRFADHLYSGPHLNMLLDALQWQEEMPSSRATMMESNPDRWEKLAHLLDHMDIDEIVSTYASFWAQGASDHLVGIDKKRAPKSLVELREELLRLRYMDFQEEFTSDDWKKIKRLFKEAAMDIDEKIVGTEPEWGEG